MVDSSYQLKSSSDFENENLQIVRCIHTFTAKLGEGYCIAISPDSRTLAVGCEEGHINLWDIESKQLKAKIAAHSKTVVKVAFSPDGLAIVSGSCDGSVKLWNVETHELSHTLIPESESRLEYLAWSADGETIATYFGSSKRINLWDARTLQLKNAWKIPECYVYNFALNHSANMIAYSFSSKIEATGKLIDTVAEMTTMFTHSYGTVRGSFYSASFSADGNFLAWGTTSNLIKLYRREPDARKFTFVKDITWDMTNEYHVQRIAFSPDSQTIAAVHSDSNVRLWDVETGKIKKIIQGHSQFVNAIAFSPDGQLFVSCSQDKTIKLWKIEKLTVSSDNLLGSLETLLAAQQWSEADKETYRVMVKIAGIDKNSEKICFTEDDIKEFPCEHLQKIEALWAKYSNGHYGLTAQKEVWEGVLRKEGQWYEMNCRPLPEEEQYQMRIGWIKIVIIRGYDGPNDETQEYSYDFKNKGHFPRGIYNARHEEGIGDWAPLIPVSVLMDKLNQCKISK